MSSEEKISIRLDIAKIAAVVVAAYYIGVKAENVTVCSKNNSEAIQRLESSDAKHSTDISAIKIDVRELQTIGRINRKEIAKTP